MIKVEEKYHKKITPAKKQKAKINIITTIACPGKSWVSFSNLESLSYICRDWVILYIELYITLTF